jgi:hypothetical protein
MHRAAIVTDKQIACADGRRQVVDSSFAAQVHDLGSTERLDCCDGLEILWSAKKNDLAIQFLLQPSNQSREQIG